MHVAQGDATSSRRSSSYFSANIVQRLYGDQF
jgi:hypothetical protein